ncbi:MAG: lytic transglycosylase domain-containing protein [Candidatus Binataceae bacterium]
MGLVRQLIQIALTFVIVLFALGAPRAIAGRGESAQSPGVVNQAALFRAAGRLYGFDPELLEAIALVESGGNPLAVSPKGAQGLMQLMPGTAAEYRVADPLDPVSNMLGAVRFLSFLRTWSHSRGGERPRITEILAAYNAGPGAVEKYDGIPPYLETQQYVRRVLINYLVGDERSPLAAKLRQMSPAPQRVLLKPQPDPMTKLIEIRRLRSVALGRQQDALAAAGYHP